jgi:tRNA(fMet)-specific endonuclease VapC
MVDTRVRALDTSAISYIQRNREPWVSQLRSLPPAQRAVPVIVAEEQMRGRLAQIARANQKGDQTAIAQAYLRFIEAITFFNTIPLLPFDEAAIARFAELRKQHRQSGTNDLRIAAIALTAGAVVVTGNVGHFSGIAGLDVETWG